MALLLLNCVIEHHWFDLSLLSLGRYSTRPYFQRHRVTQCNETLLLNFFLVIARVSLSSTKVLSQFKISVTRNSPTGVP